MMDKEYSSHNELKEFIAFHNLRDNFSRTHFNSVVSIATSTIENKIINKRMKVKISFGDFGSLGLVEFIERELDLNLYPDNFDAKFQKMEHVENEHLKITGIHPNPKIGKYIVKILPLNKLRD